MTGSSGAPNSDDMGSTDGRSNERHPSVDQSALVNQLLEAVLNERPELKDLVESPDTWDNLDPEMLTPLIRREILHYGLTSDALLVERLYRLYKLGMERLSVEERVELLGEIIDFVDHVPFAANALNPFIFAEREFSIIASAALGLACELGTRDDDPLTGPNYVRALAEHSDDAKLRAGLYAGLLLTGDFRLYDLIDRCWETLPPEARHLLTRIETDFPTVFLANFYLDWLESVDEDQDDAEFGDVAGALARLAREHNTLLDIERKYPAWKDDDAPPVIVLEQWAINQFGRHIEHRLRDIMELESEPKILPAVLQYWGIDP